MVWFDLVWSSLVWSGWMVFMVNLTGFGCGMSCKGGAVNPETALHHADWVLRPLSRNVNFLLQIDAFKRLIFLDQMKRMSENCPNHSWKHNIVVIYCLVFLLWHICSSWYMQPKQVISATPILRMVDTRWFDFGTIHWLPWDLRLGGWQGGLSFCSFSFVKKEVAGR